ncbi:putative ABC transport system, lipoprotein [Gemmatirosa kalamazoonensis]|uniref:Putative ABC transport system, lipoprotein n=1 Tax=Gemmatirosa kalamazoonensis TaxID=861299 RepID=W0RG65_9BACT|nr:HlyD family efflux transporter periplasmic adaptor subunit [Gemmatirosa kalamazoonensis]AHG89315.1 putative ABC transport system, lipoprotein [Gemmatirosa kalamazoonensis]
MPNADYTAAWLRGCVSARDAATQLRSHAAGVLLRIALVSVAACAPKDQPDAYGTMEAPAVVVGAEVGGRLIAFAPVEGDRLPAGATAAVVDTTPLVLQLRQIAAQRAGGEARTSEVTKQIGVLQVQREIARRAYERTRRLYDQQAATAQQLDQTERDYRVLGEQIAAARSQHTTAGQDVASTDARAAMLRDQIRRSRVANPVNGTVLATYAKAGEVVQPGQPLYRVASLDTMELRAYVAESQLAQVRLGRSATVTVDAAGGARRALSGTVSWVASEAEFTPTPIQTRDERTSLVYAVKIRVPNADGALKIGMPADVRFVPLATAAR